MIRYTLLILRRKSIWWIGIVLHIVLLGLLYCNVYLQSRSYLHVKRSFNQSPQYVLEMDTKTMADKESFGNYFVKMKEEVGERTTLSQNEIERISILHEIAKDQKAIEESASESEKAFLYRQQLYKAYFLDHPNISYIYQKNHTPFLVFYSQEGHSLFALGSWLILLWVTVDVCLQDKYLKKHCPYRSWYQSFAEHSVLFGFSVGVQSVVFTLMALCISIFFGLGSFNYPIYVHGTYQAISTYVPRIIANQLLATLWMVIMMRLCTTLIGKDLFAILVNISILFIGQAFLSLGVSPFAYTNAFALGHYGVIVAWLVAGIVLDKVKTMLQG